MKYCNKIFSFINIVKHIGIINTFRLNYNYFGLQGVLKCYVLAARKLKILQIDGHIEFIDEPQTAGLMIGFPSVGIFDYKIERSIWQMSGGGDAYW